MAMMWWERRRGTVSWWRGGVGAGVYGVEAAEAKGGRGLSVDWRLDAVLSPRTWGWPSRLGLARRGGDRGGAGGSAAEEWAAAAAGGGCSARRTASQAVIIPPAHAAQGSWVRSRGLSNPRGPGPDRLAEGGHGWAGPRAQGRAQPRARARRAVASSPWLRERSRRVAGAAAPPRTTRAQAVARSGHGPTRPGPARPGSAAGVLVWLRAMMQRHLTILVKRSCCVGIARRGASRAPRVPDAHPGGGAGPLREFCDLSLARPLHGGAASLAATKPVSAPPVSAPPGTGPSDSESS
jgi:hypothetical protein